MMEIKHKGKSALSGEWVFGYFRLKNKDKCVIYDENDNEIPIIAGTQRCFVMRLVNGQELYEGDNVEYVLFDIQGAKTGIIFYDNNNAMFLVGINDRIPFSEIKFIRKLEV